MGQHEIRPGNVVRLHSGGPVMTVGAIGGWEGCRCFWFMGVDLKSATIPPAALVVVRDGGKAVPAG